MKTFHSKVLLILLICLPVQANWKVTRLNDVSAILLNEETGESYVSTACSKEQARAYSDTNKAVFPFRCWIKMDIIQDWKEATPLFKPSTFKSSTDR